MRTRDVPTADGSRESCETCRVIGPLLIASAALTAGLVAAAARLPSLVSTLLAAYLAFVANAVAVTVALSPFREVTRGGLLGAEAVLLVVAFAGWWVRGRPGLPLGGARVAVAEVAGSPLTALFLAVAALALAYELLLALAVPPNNWDSLTYHLSRVASWVQHGGYHWIANAPDDILNTRQPVAEQVILFLFVATGKGTLFALPQYVAQLAILVAVYGSSRRLGFGVCPAVCSAALVATFSLFALEAMTAQNDLVAASFVAAAACLILGGSRAELVLAGIAVGMGIGVKLTTAFVWPVLVLLAWSRGRRGVPWAAAGAIGGFAVVGMWGYLLNLEHTGHLLGQGRFRLDVSASPSFPGSLATSLHVLYRMFDLSVLSYTLVYWLADLGLLAAAAVAVHAYRRGGARRAVIQAAAVAVPFLSPALVIGGAAVLGYLTKHAGIPVANAGFAGEFNRRANEDLSAFGPVGTVTLLVVPVLTVAAFWTRRVDARYLALALALPVSLILIGLEVEYNPFLPRFLLAPAALTAPLFGFLFRRRAATAALLAVASLTVVLTLAHDRTKPFWNPNGRPWQLTQAQALEADGGVPQFAPALTAYDSHVPAHACVGAVLGADEPSYILWGPNLTRRIVFLPARNAVEAAQAAGPSYVVVSSASHTGISTRLRTSGWTLQPLGVFWILATRSPVKGGGCPV
jgi:hypothetical protein